MAALATPAQLAAYIQQPLSDTDASALLMLGLLVSLVLSAMGKKVKWINA